MPAQTLGSPTQSTPAERRVDVGVGFGGPTATRVELHDDTRIQLAYSTGHLGRAHIMPMLQPSQGSPKFSASQARVSEASATRTSA